MHHLSPATPVIDSPAPGRQGGFTLIEVLIATSLLGMMMLVLMGSLRIGAASWDAGEKRMAESGHLNTLQHFLRGHIASALPLTGQISDGRTVFLFQGRSDFLEYVAPMPAQVKNGGLYRFRLYVTGEDEQRSLRMAILSYKSAQPGRPGLRKMEPVEDEVIDDLEIITHLGDFRLSYLPRIPFTADRNNTDNTWQEEWVQPVLPALVRMELSPAAGKPWPVLTIALKIPRIR